ncbi:hypothetical protein HNQ93_002490 [Hymenobacter luteus]|uniref:DNA repair protein n=2 Tax=Hymenobacter TaxID=89966 RepID=A0A7W9WCL5_9BACT|nr:MULTISPECIES: CRISPR-associated endonuclease Cas6 [Hymenobacter]MBB4601941.1 hypothetical protein [Hymenobacter latericoloratus]MBB6059630.1 hypothetical protein [Hymenobacter luteus]
MSITTHSDTIALTTITLPDIRLRTRDAHKLRGYFGELFRDHSPLLHNHYEDGTYRQQYPLVQYKVLAGTPTLLGLGEGATLLVELFLRIRELQIEGHHYPVQAKHIVHQQAAIGPAAALHRYRFETLWMPLNQENHREYQTLGPEERQRQLTRILTNNILALLKATGTYAPDMPRLLLHVALSEPVPTRFKNQPMVAFGGEFVANVVLPDRVGLGKSVARGFGAVRRVK